MRPELVKSNPVPLCPDSYSGFNLENKQAHNFEIKEVCSYNLKYFGLLTVPC
jgi:hypothetical protein